MSSSIEFGDNELTGTVPSEFGRLSKMVHTLTASSNSLVCTRVVAPLSPAFRPSIFPEWPFIAFPQRPKHSTNALYKRTHEHAHLYLQRGTLPTQLGFLVKMTANLEFGDSSMAGNLPTELGVLVLMTR